MQLSDQPDKIPLAFAENGEKDVIPEGSSPFDGRASLNDGFPPPTRQALIDGGIPPNGLDMNGILWLATAINRWQSAGGFFAYDSAFATDTNVNGYPKGAMLVRSDGTGFWVSTTDDNTTDPDAGGAGWQPVNNIGIHSVSMTGSDVTLTAAQAAKDLIVISGTLSANVNLILPTTVKSWIITNNTTGAYTITCKTASGTGGLITQGTSRVFYGDGTNLYGVNPLAGTQAQVDAGTDTFTFLTPKTFKDSSLRAVKATQVEVDAGTDDTKFVTASTLANDAKWATKAALAGSNSQTFAVATATSDNHAVPKAQYETAASETVQGISRFATLVELAAGILNYVGVSPNTLLNGMSKSIAANGYLSLPSWLGGLIIQWGSGTYTNGVTVTFPGEFPTACYSVITTANAASAVGNVAHATPSSVTDADFVWNGAVIYSDGSGADPSTIAGWWIAIGV